MAWLNGWAKRVKLTIDHNDIDAALSNFPILVYVSALSGHSGKDISCVFDELTTNDNRKKIAVTTSDGETQCYVEIEKWDDANEKAWLWVKVPSIASDADTELYLYYDHTKDDNTAYIGDPSDAVVHNVWDSNFKLVTHMRDDPDTSHIRDSTVEANDGTKKAAGEPAVTTAGKIAEAQDFDGIDDYIQTDDAPSLDISGASPITQEAWVKLDALPSSYPYAVTMFGETGHLSTTWDKGIRITTAGKATFYVYDGKVKEVIGATTLEIGVWYRLVGLYDGTNVKIYVNGVDDESAPKTATKTYDFTTPQLVLSYKSGSAVELYWTEYVDGIIDEVRISATARTAAWIKASYESGRDDLLDFGSEETAAVTKTKTYTLAARLLKLQTKTFTLTGKLVRPYTKEYSLTARIFKRQTKEYSLAGRLFKTQTKDYTLAARLRKTQEKAYSLAARLLKTQTKDYTLAAKLIKRISKTYTLAGKLIEVKTKTYTLAAKLVSRVTKTYTVAARLIKKNITQTYTLAARLIKTQEKPYTLAARLKKVAEKPYTLAARLIKTTTKAYSLTAKLVSKIEKTYSLSAKLFKRQTATYSLAAKLVKRTLKTYSLAARVFKLQTQTYSLAARLRKLQEKTYTLAGKLIKVRAKTYSLTGRLFKTATKTYTVAGKLIARTTKTYSLAARLKKVQTKAYTLAARLVSVVTRTKTYTLGARLKKLQAQTYTLAARLFRLTTKTYTLGARLVQIATKTYSLAARLFKVQTQTYTLGARLIKVETQTYTIAAYLISHEHWLIIQTVATLEERITALELALEPKAHFMI